MQVADGSSLVSIVGDYHAFCRMIPSKSRHGSQRLLSRPAVEQMTADQLTPENRIGTEFFLGDGASWGVGNAVVTRRADLSTTPGVSDGTAATAPPAIPIRPRTLSTS